MKNLYLIRHGQSLGNLNPTLYGKIPDWKIPLSDIGTQQALDAGRQLRNKHTGGVSLSVYYSPMNRAKSTYLHGIRNQIGKFLLFEKEEPLVSEQSFGMINSYSESFTNFDMMKVRQEYGSFYYTPPDGESGLDVLMRVKRFLDEVKDRNQKNVVVVSHGSFIKVLMMELLNWSVDMYDSIKRPDNGEIIHLSHSCGWVCNSEIKLRNQKITTPEDYA